MLEAVENSIVLATFSLIEFVSALIGTLVAGVLLASTGIPLLLYGFDIPTRGLLHWLVPPLH